MLDQIDFIYRAAETRRFHTFPVIHQETIAHHSWRVAMLLYTIFGQEPPGITFETLMAALTHDAAEYEFGDLPAPAKRQMNDTLDLHESETRQFKQIWDEMEQAHLANFSMDWEKFLSDEQKAMIKLCDSLDGAFYCIKERSLGNQQIERCWVNFSKYIEALIDEHWPQREEVPIDPESQTTADRVNEVWQMAKLAWEKYNGR